MSGSNWPYLGTVHDGRASAKLDRDCRSGNVEKGWGKGAVRVSGYVLPEPMNGNGKRCLRMSYGQQRERDFCEKNCYDYQVKLFVRTAKGNAWWYRCMVHAQAEARKLVERTIYKVR